VHNVGPKITKALKYQTHLPQINVPFDLKLYYVFRPHFTVFRPYFLQPTCIIYCEILQLSSEHINTQILQLSSEHVNTQILQLSSEHVNTQILQLSNEHVNTQITSHPLPVTFTSNTRYPPICAVSKQKLCELMYYNIRCYSNCQYAAYSYTLYCLYTLQHCIIM
jgi:uncharacterized membrane protein YraQ (UPF0718 family)